MNIVITGGAGFLGARLARTLLAQNQVALAGAAPRPRLVCRMPWRARSLTIFIRLFLDMPCPSAISAIEMGRSVCSAQYISTRRV